MVCGAALTSLRRTFLHPAHRWAPRDATTNPPLGKASKGEGNAPRRGCRNATGESGPRSRVVDAAALQGSTHDTRHAGATNGRKSCLSTPYLTVHWLSIHPIARSKTWHGAGAGCFAPAESRQPEFDCLGATAPCQGHALSLGRRPERKKSFSCGIWSALAAERRTTTTSRAKPTPSGRAPGPAPVPPCGAAALQALRPPKRQHKMIDTGRVR